MVAFDGTGRSQPLITGRVLGALEQCTTGPSEDGTTLYERMFDTSSELHRIVRCRPA